MVDDTHMMVHPETVMAIILMASMTYLTRITGYLLLGGRQMSDHMRQVMEAALGCVLVAVIVPYFATNNHGDLLALGLTALAASRCSLLSTILIGVGCAWGLRNVLHL
ncbi:AzlD family protein [Acetobacter orientalis]|uniref:AzlD family protein n=1 Tax=Acetobacter orientalis TaxID=146474 RepID=UPI0039E7B12C